MTNKKLYKIFYNNENYKIEAIEIVAESHKEALNFFKRKFPKYADRIQLDLFLSKEEQRGNG